MANGNGAIYGSAFAQPAAPAEDAEMADAWQRRMKAKGVGKGEDGMDGAWERQGKPHEEMVGGLSTQEMFRQLIQGQAQVQSTVTSLGK